MEPVILCQNELELLLNQITAQDQTAVAETLLKLNYSYHVNSRLFNTHITHIFELKALLDFEREKYIRSVVDNFLFHVKSSIYYEGLSGLGLRDRLFLSFHPEAMKRLFQKMGIFKSDLNERLEVCSWINDRVEHVFNKIKENKFEFYTLEKILKFDDVLAFELFLSGIIEHKPDLLKNFERCKDFFEDDIKKSIWAGRMKCLDFARSHPLCKNIVRIAERHFIFKPYDIMRILHRFEFFGRVLYGGLEKVFEPIHYAVSVNDHETVEFYLKNIVEKHFPQLKCRIYDKIVTVACRYGHIDMVEKYMKKAVSYRDMRPIVYVAACRNHVNIIENYFEDLTESFREKVLIRAVEHHSYDILTYLLNRYTFDQKIISKLLYIAIYKHYDSSIIFLLVSKYPDQIYLVGLIEQAIEKNDPVIADIFIRIYQKFDSSIIYWAARKRLYSTMFLAAGIKMIPDGDVLYVQLQQGVIAERHVEPLIEMIRSGLPNLCNIPVVALRQNIEPLIQVVLQYFDRAGNYRGMLQLAQHRGLTIMAERIKGIMEYQENDQPTRRIRRRHH